MRHAVMASKLLCLHCGGCFVAMGSPPSGKHTVQNFLPGKAAVWVLFSKLVLAPQSVFISSRAIFSFSVSRMFIFLFGMQSEHAIFCSNNEASGNGGEIEVQLEDIHFSSNNEAPGNWGHGKIMYN